MRLPNPNETLFIDPRDESFWYLKLAAQGGGQSGEVVPIEMSGIGVFPPKEVQNDWTRASHQVLSSFIQSDTTGGAQIRETDEATDASRYYFGTANTQYPRQVTLARRSEFVDAGAPVIPLGDYGVSTFLYVAGNTLYQMDDSTPTLIGVLAGVPKKTLGVTFRGLAATNRFFISVVGGYQIWDGITLSGLITDISPVSWQIWNRLLYALLPDGRLMESTTGNTTTWIERASVDGSYIPLHLIEFFDRSDEPNLHIITKTAVFAVDIANSKTYRTGLRPPRHPDAGLAACVFRNDLFVSYGISVDQYTGTSIIPQGLDRDYGLPPEYAGRIVSMSDGYNGVYALVEGKQIVTGEPGPDIIDDYDPNQPVLPAPNAPSMIWVFDVNGWHPIWHTTELGEAPTLITMCNSNDRFRLVWGSGNRLYWQNHSVSLFNPINRGPDWEFEEESFIEYGELDFAMTGFRKLMIAIEVRARDITATETITVEYSLDDGIWQELGVINTQPFLRLTRMLLGANGVFPDGITPRYDGISGNAITYRAFLKRGSDTRKTPILESIGVVFHKYMGTLNGYTMVIDCSEGNGYNNKSNAEMEQFLHEMIDSPKLIPWYHNGQWRSVRLAGVSGPDDSGTARKGWRNISLLEVLDPFPESVG